MISQIKQLRLELRLLTPRRHLTLDTIFPDESLAARKMPVALEVKKLPSELLPKKESISSWKLSIPTASLCGGTQLMEVQFLTPLGDTKKITGCMKKPVPEVTRQQEEILHWICLKKVT